MATRLGEKLRELRKQRGLTLHIQRPAGTDKPFRRLRPAWVIDMRVHVGEETVFVRRGEIPCCGRTLAGELNTDDRFNALKAIFPRYRQPDGGAVLRRERFTVNADGQKGKRMHGFVKA